MYRHAHADSTAHTFSRDIYTSVVDTNSVFPTEKSVTDCFVANDVASAAAAVFAAVSFRFPRPDNYNRAG